MELGVEDSGITLVGGKNGQGKTSVLNALRMALCGRRDFAWPEQIIAETEDSAKVEVTLSGDPSLMEERSVKVVLDVNRKRNGEVENITLLDSVGDEAPSPRTLLRSLYHHRAFDPLHFERQKPKEQREMLAKLVGVDLDASRELYETVYSERKAVNRELQACKIECENLTWAKDAPDKPIDTASLIEELRHLQAHRRAAREAQLDVHKRAEETLEGKESVALEEAEIAKCKKRLAAAKAAKKEKEQVVVELVQEEERAKEALANIGPTESDDELMQKISECGELNALLAENQKNDALVEKKKAVQREANELTERLDEITKSVEEEIRNAPFPVPDMGIEKDGVTLRGRPFSTCSRSERIVASAAVGMALNPSLRLLVCEDGSDLDNDALDALDQVLKANDFQAIVEVVTRSTQDESRCKVVMQAGGAK